MTVNLSYLDDLSRVRIEISNFPDGTVKVERYIATNPNILMTVRGGAALPVVAGAAQLDDYEFFDLESNCYKVTSTSTEDNVAVFLSSGTWTKPVGLVAVIVECIGGGGGGGGANTTAGGQSSVGAGGGAGEYRRAIIPAASLGASETVTVGAGGTGVSAGTGNTGSNTSYGAHLTASGGLGGSASTSGAGPAFGSGGNGGSGGGGSATNAFTVPGEDGTSAFVVGGNVVCLGQGGSSALGGGQRASSSASGVNGVSAPANSGAGGSGGFNFASQGSARTGGNGGSGIVIVTQLYEAVD